MGSRLAPADGSPCRRGAWPAQGRRGDECIELRRLECGVLTDLDRLALDGLRPLGEGYGNGQPAQRSTLRVHRRHHPGRRVYLDSRPLFLRCLFRGRHQHRLWPPASRPSQRPLRPPHSGEGAHRRAISCRLRLSLSSRHASRSHSASSAGGLHLLGQGQLTVPSIVNRRAVNERAISFAYIHKIGVKIQMLPQAAAVGGHSGTWAARAVAARFFPPETRADRCSPGRSMLLVTTEMPRIPTSAHKR